MSRDHVLEFMERELAAPSPTTSGNRGEDMALAAGSVLFVMGCNAVVPVAGAAAAAATLAGLTFDRRSGARDLSHVEEAVALELDARELLPSGEPGASSEERACAQAWSTWCPWEELREGAHVPVPASLPHPSEAGFEPTRLASSIGQTRDWAHPLADGSRLHVHEFCDGECVVHRDSLDPARGPATATVHWLTEAPEGNLALGVGALVGAVALAWALGS